MSGRTPSAILPMGSGVLPRTLGACRARERLPRVSVGSCELREVATVAARIHRARRDVQNIKRSMCNVGSARGGFNIHGKVSLKSQPKEGYIAPSSV